MNYRKLLLETRIKNGLATEVRCSEQESKEYKKILMETGSLPEGIYERTEEDGTYSYYYYSNKYDISPEEMNELLLNLQLKSINTIKVCVVFFTIIAIISLLASGIALGITISKGSELFKTISSVIPR